MDHRLRRMFDQVRMGPDQEEAILADLLNEAGGNVPEQRRARTIPKFALIAAALAIVMAGTALAAYWGRVSIEAVDDFGIRGWNDGYRIYSSDCVIPLDSLSAEVRNAFTDSMDASNYISFKSWSDAEAFLGLELADNAQLDQIAKAKRIQYKPSGDTKLKKAWSHCLMSINLPWIINVCTFYEKNNCTIIESVQIKTDYGTDDPSLSVTGGWQVPFQGDAEFLSYKTPGGLEVSICKDIAADGEYERTTYNAYFVKNNALFNLELMSTERWRLHRENLTFFDPWDTLVEILDAYE